MSRSPGPHIDVSYGGLGVEPFLQLTTDIMRALECELSQVLSDSEQGLVQDVCRYAVLDGGHRWRGLFVFGVAVAAGERLLEDNPVMPVACSMELVHAASLMLDDSPSMDNAEMRRGKPCAHRIYPLWAVELGSVLMLSIAHRKVVSTPRIAAERRIVLVNELARVVQVMVHGQELDITGCSPHEDWNSLLDCYTRKTGSLMGIGAKMAALACGCDTETCQRFHDCGLNAGICYQILDDIADANSTFEAMGKRPGKDALKVTSVTLHGVEESLKISHEYREKALAIIEGNGGEADFLRFLIGRMLCAGDSV